MPQLGEFPLVFLEMTFVGFAVALLARGRFGFGMIRAAIVAAIPVLIFGVAPFMLRFFHIPFPV